MHEEIFQAFLDRYGKEGGVEVLANKTKNV